MHNYLLDLLKNLCILLYHVLADEEMFKPAVSFSMINLKFDLEA